MNNTRLTMALTYAKTNGMKIRGRISFKSGESGATVVPLVRLRPKVKDEEEEETFRTTTRRTDKNESTKT